MDFWHAHSLLFLFGIALFPRITMLIATSMSFGALGWIGWLFAPHLTVAILATSLYWNTNPVLVIIAWMFALGGTGTETKTATTITRRTMDRFE